MYMYMHNSSVCLCVCMCVCVCVCACVCMCEAHFSASNSGEVNFFIHFLYENNLVQQFLKGNCTAIMSA